MTETTLWWLLAGGTVIAELLTGTFFLLMLSVGMAAAALAAQAGASSVAQLLVAAVTGGGAVVGWYFVKKRRQGRAPDAGGAALNLDVGETVMIESWQPDGTARVKYRGANWTALHRAGIAPSAGPHRVADIVGTRLVVEKLS